MRRARLPVSPGLVAELMHMPMGTNIVGAWWDFECDGGVIQLVVESPDLPEVSDGELLPEVNPTVTKEAVHWNWNL